MNNTDVELVKKIQFHIDCMICEKCYVVSEALASVSNATKGLYEEIDKDEIAAYKAVYL